MVEPWAEAANAAAGVEVVVIAAAVARAAARRRRCAGAGRPLVRWGADNGSVREIVSWKIGAGS